MSQVPFVSRPGDRWWQTTSSHGQPWQGVTLLSARVSILHHSPTGCGAHQVLEGSSLLWVSSEQLSRFSTEEKRFHGRPMNTLVLLGATKIPDLDKFMELTSQETGAGAAHGPSVILTKELSGHW